MSRMFGFATRGVHGNWRCNRRIVHPLTDQNGSAFWAVIAVLLVTSLLFSTVVFYGAWHQTQNRRLLYETQGQYLAIAALETVRARLDGEGASGEILAGEILAGSLAGRRSWRAAIAPWGCYWRAVCTGKSHQFTHTIDALIGRHPPADFNLALKLFGPPYPLVLAGESQIRGDVATGTAGVMAGRFRGRDRTDSVLVNGQVVTTAQPRAPTLDWSVWNAFQDRIGQLRGSIPIRTDRTLIVDDTTRLTPGDSVIIVNASVTVRRQHDLVTQTSAVILIASGPVLIAGITCIDARCAIISDRSIEVADSARVSGVVLHAPRIVIRDAARFSGQALADTLLEVKDRAVTVFPSLLWVTGSRKSGAAPVLRLTSREPCAGIAGISPGAGEIRNRSHQPPGELLVDAQSRWTGYLEVCGKAVIGGEVAGSVQAELLGVEDPPTIYLNWLLDAVIDRKAWDGWAALPAFAADAGSWTFAEFVSPRASLEKRPESPGNSTP